MASISKAVIGEQDLNLWDGVNTTFTRDTSTGSTLTLRQVGTEVDALMSYGGGVNFTNATITSALTAIGTINKATLVLRPGTWVISANVDWSAYLNVTFKVPSGTLISHGAYTINIPNLDAGFYEIFSGTGAVTLGGSVRDVNPMWFGAVGDGSTDDTTGWQKALDVAARNKRRFFIPAPTVNWKLTDELVLRHPTAGQYFQMDIYAEGPDTEIVWGGADSKSIFHSYGWLSSTIQGVRVTVDTGTSVVVWDVDDDPTWTAFTGSLTFINCRTRLLTCTNCVNFRGGAGEGNGVDSMLFINFQVASDTIGGNIGWQPIHANALGWTWISGNGIYLNWIYDCNNTIIAGGAGGGTAHFYNFEGSHNTGEFRFSRGGEYGIHGGRYEVGKLFLSTDQTGASGGTGNINVTMDGVQISAYTPADDILFVLAHSTALTLNGCSIVNNAALHTLAMITIQGAAAARGSVVINGGTIYADDPFWTITSGGYRISLLNVGKAAIDGTVTAFFPNPDANVRKISTLADDATPSVLNGYVFLTGGTTTITDFDDGVTGQIITIVSEHAITITDGTNIYLSGSANFVMAATDTLTLICKADNKWYEISRSDNT